MLISLYSWQHLQLVNTKWWLSYSNNIESTAKIRYRIIKTLLTDKTKEMVEISPTVAKTASIASRNDIKTFNFFSLNFPNIAEISKPEYVWNFFRKPLASPVTHFPASATTITLLSLVIIYKYRRNLV